MSSIDPSDNDQIVTEELHCLHDNSFNEMKDHASLDPNRRRFLGYALRQKKHPHVSLGWTPEGTKRRVAKRYEETVSSKETENIWMASWIEAVAVAKDQEWWRGVGENALKALYDK